MTEQAPVCNTGVHPPASRPAGFAHESRFDWYRATVPVHPAVLIDACIRLAGDGARVQEGPGRFNYANKVEVTVGGDRVATVLHGGRNGHPNVEASSDRAPALAELLRANGPHRVTRCDVAFDVYGQGLFLELEQLVCRIGLERRVAVDKHAKPNDRTKGETIYLGSKDSSHFMRCYEKGKADRRVYSDIAPSVLLPWVRCELQVMPEKDMKAVAATMPPEAFWGISDWSIQFASEAFSMAPHPIPFHPRRTSSDDRAFAFMCAQYRNLLRRRADDRHGGDREALLQEIGRVVFDQAQKRDAA